MDVCDTTHGHERKVMQNPADKRVESRVMHTVEVVRFEVGVAALPPDREKKDYQDVDTEGGGAAPIDGRVAK
jgi:hypothetical protein